MLLVKACEHGSCLATGLRHVSFGQVLATGVRPVSFGWFLATWVRPMSLWPLVTGSNLGASSCLDIV
jgi:hypothetical protein